MTEARIETWQVGVGSQRELGVIRDALRENPAVTDSKRKAVALEGSLRLERDRVLAEVQTANNRCPGGRATTDLLSARCRDGSNQGRP